MAKYAGANQRPLGTQTEPKITPNIVILHTMAGSLAGTEAFFKSKGYDGVESHFGVGGGGAVRQWQDTGRQADANYQANDRAISIETEDKNSKFFPSWSGSNVPKWTEAQMQALALLLAWIHEEHGIPLQLVPDSKPGRTGIAYHRQGIDGNYSNGRVSGGEHWSVSRGKVCPGDRRIAQIPELIDRARALVGKVPVSKPVEDASDHELVVDGVLGPHTIGEWQRDAGTVVDRKISSRLVTRTYGKIRVIGSVGESMLIKHEQKRLGCKVVDGFISTPKSKFVKALQRDLKRRGYYGGKIDGRIDAGDSLTIRALQRALNDGNLS